MTPDLTALLDALAGRYAIERELGQGGMATVYLARDLRHARSVAIKVLQPELAAALGGERFLREVAVTARLSHPHILPLLDSGEAAGTLFYVMPYVAGETLRHRLEREKQLPIADALAIAREVADALDYAHRQQVVHRDIKPENILLEDGHAVVADFGIARVLDTSSVQALTGTGLAIGTPAYMSPEQATGMTDVDGRSDIYALGCLLHEMLAGQPPFTGPVAQSVIRQHVTADPPTLTDMRGAVPPAISAVVRRALGKSPADRQQTASAFAAELVQAAQAPLHSEVRSQEQPIARTSRRPGKGALVAAGVMLVLLIGAVAMRYGMRPGSPDAGARLTRLVVLPFENIGRAEDAYFADGVTEEIASRLGQAPGVSVIGRVTASQYNGTNAALSTIGRELDVQYALTGTVRWSDEPAGRRVRIIPRLMRVSDQSQLWTDRFESAFTEVFATQGRIASEVVSALGITLGSIDAVRDSTPPTRNIGAYEEYVRGSALLAQCTVVPCQRAVEAAARFESAVRLDSTFAAAWAGLATAWPTAGGAALPANLARAKIASEKALLLAPQLAEAHAAAARVIAASRQDNAKAEAEYLRALALQPSQPSALRGLAILYRYQGKLDEAAEQLLRAAVLDPRDLSAQYDLGVTYQRLRRYEEAERFLERAIALNPSDANPLVRLAILKLMRAGDVAGARQVLARTSDPFYALISMTSFVLSAEMRVVLCDACAGAAASRLRALGPVPRDSVADPSAWLWRGRVAQLAGQPVVARAAFDSALQRMKRQVDSVPGARSDFSVQRSLTEVAALAGRRDVALTAARETVRLLQETPNGTWGPDAMNIAAEVFAKFGDDSAALENLDRALTLPSHVTVALVRLNPVWARFKGVPAFEQMLARH